jgi:hypothetical protein
VEAVKRIREEGRLGTKGKRRGGGCAEDREEGGEAGLFVCPVQ